MWLPRDCLSKARQHLAGQWKAELLELYGLLEFLQLTLIFPLLCLEFIQKTYNFSTIISPIFHV